MKLLWFQSIISSPTCNVSYLEKHWWSEFPSIEVKCCNKNGCNWNNETTEQNIDYDDILVCLIEFCDWNINITVLAFSRGVGTWGTPPNYFEELVSVPYLPINISRNRIQINVCPCNIWHFLKHLFSICVSLPPRLISDIWEWNSAH